MTNTPYVSAAIAHGVLKSVPPLIRDSLLDRPEFRQEYGFRRQAVLNFDEYDLSIQRSEMFDAIRRTLADEADRTVTDTQGGEWMLINEAATGQQPTLIVSSGEQRLVLPDCAVLSPDAAVRLRSLDELAFDVNLPVSGQSVWREILKERALEDEEVYPFYSDVWDTPVHLIRATHRKILTTKGNVSSFIPSSRRYFERLVGTYDGSVSVKDYAAGAGKNFLEQLSEWCPYEGFVFSLLLSSHSALTAEIRVDRLDNEDLVRAYDFISRGGDVISRLGAIEVGLRILPEHAEVEPYIIRLIEQLRDDECEGSTNAFELFAALFVLVDGELSRMRLMSTRPPFYRRLASLSQAALVHGHFVRLGVEGDPFCGWALENYSQKYYLQALSDMASGATMES